VEGFDTERIATLSKSIDQREDPVLGRTYRVRILETATDGLRRLKRVTRLSHQSRQQEVEHEAAQLAIEDKKESLSSSSDSSSSSSSSHKKSKKHGKKHKKSKKSKKHCKKEGRRDPDPEESWLRSRLLVLLVVLQRPAASSAAARPLPKPGHCVGRPWQPIAKKCSIESVK
jgi:hypothetical protein